MATDRGKYIVVEDWMFDLCNAKGERLTDTALHLYALIYAFTKHGAGCYIADREYAAKRLRVSRSSIKNAFKLLVESGLIRDEENLPMGSTSQRKWVVTEESCEGKHERKGSQTNLNHEHCRVIKTPDETGQKQANKTSGSIFGCEEFSGSNIGFDEGQILTSTRTKSNPENYPSLQMEDSLPVPHTENKSNSKPSNHPSNLPYPQSGEDGVDFDPEVIKLMDLSLNPRAGYDEVYAAYLQAIQKGYSPDCILRGYQKYITRYKSDNTTPRYAMRLDKYLKDATGLSFDIPLPKKRQNLAKPPYQETKSIADYLAERYPDYKALGHEHVQLSVDLLREKTGKAISTERQRELEVQIEKVKTDMSRFQEEHEDEYKEFLSVEGGQHAR